MSLRLRHLRLRVSTASGMFGVDLPFEDGLVVLRADNSMGKSTCVQAILYALGLERMISSSLEVPLPPSVTRMIDTGSVELPVLESTVFLEVENHEGSKMTVQRAIAGERNRKLISVWEGAVLSGNKPTASARDYFVHDPGAATREAGFHHRLADFVGWQLPTVSRFNGTEAPLYIECIFPLMFVEQKHGWSGIQANLPTFLGIKEMGKRAIEFLLALSAPDLTLIRQRVDQDIAAIKQRWTASRETLLQQTRMAGAFVEGFPNTPTVDWPPEVDPYLSMSIDGKVVRIEEGRATLKSRLEALAKAEEVDVEKVAPELSEKLNVAKSSLAELEINGNELFEDVEGERLQLQAIGQRLAALRDDLRKNKDIQKLRKLGSTATLNVSEGTCPTCHQHISDSLLPEVTGETTMSIDENVSFIESQLKAFEKMEKNSSAALAHKERLLTAARERTAQIRAEIRAIRQALVSPSNSPSIVAIRQRIEIEDKLRRLGEAEEQFAVWWERFASIATEWKDVQQRKSEIPQSALTVEDEAKLSKLEASFLDQVRNFGLQSVSPDSLNVSRDTYRPTRDGFNLGFDLSASDNIRMIWAYLNGLLEVSRSEATHHLGMLVFDEPRQQDTADVSFEELLRRVAGASKFGQQVFFATSERLDILTSMLADVPHSLHAFSGKILKPVGS